MAKASGQGSQLGQLQAWDRGLQEARTAIALRQIPCRRWEDRPNQNAAERAGQRPFKAQRVRGKLEVTTA
jgi:hypothetical protein